MTLTSFQAESALETISNLAIEIGRHCPTCATKASQIVALTAELYGSAADRSTIQDVIEAEALDDGMSDAKVSTTTDAVVKAMRSGA
jgi:hypothetical protein